MALALHNRRVIDSCLFEIRANPNRLLTEEHLHNLYLAENLLHKLPVFSAVYAARGEIVAIACGCKNADDVSGEVYGSLAHTYKVWRERMPDGIVGVINFPAIEANYNSMSGQLEVLYSTEPNPRDRPVQVNRFLTSWLGPIRQEGDTHKLMDRIYIEPKIHHS